MTSTRLKTICFVKFILFADYRFKAYVSKELLKKKISLKLLTLFEQNTDVQKTCQYCIMTGMCI